MGLISYFMSCPEANKGKSSVLRLSNDRCGRELRARLCASPHGPIGGWPFKRYCTRWTPACAGAQ